MAALAWWYGIESQQNLCHAAWSVMKEQFLPFNNKQGECRGF
jgi:hypothetical protein